MPVTILFYRPAERYGYMSNFSRHPVEIDDVRWPTTEHFFQAMKSLDPDIQEAIRNLATPGKAKSMGNTIERRPDWENPAGSEHLDAIFTDPWGVAVHLVKDHFMFTALVAKFTQHEDLKRELLSTGDAILIENTQSVGSDPYWGNGPSGTGLNKLGRQLMIVRKRLRETT